MAKKRKNKSGSTGPSVSKKQPAACVLPNLYLGPVSAASNVSFLTNNGITHVLSIGKSPSAVNHLESINYQRLGLIDEEDCDIRPVVERACQFIDSMSSSNEKVLVHCSAAISRSPTIVAAYLMKSCGMTLMESLKILVNARDAIAPNPGFLRQLVEMEREIFDDTTFDATAFDGRNKLANMFTGP
ncbi:phosphatases II [Lindgomyces ingoldianus]|uniref:Phosphatases II n=1 Tax=Lindgomyces ingoldianus TaxID=673940 RepID=A0ACB6QM26_9PLEO|nr:phosphatases II [Lindgomyces ingoldianus]KAF2467951.1 phosphatases II [Lindgomyces ingoldianus]